jgi:hypothetical protein
LRIENIWKLVKRFEVLLLGSKIFITYFSLNIKYWNFLAPTASEWVRLGLLKNYWLYISLESPKNYWLYISLLAPTAIEWVRLGLLKNYSLYISLGSPRNYSLYISLGISPTAHEC